MPSDKHNSITAKATGLILSLFDMAVYNHWTRLVDWTGLFQATDGGRVSGNWDICPGPHSYIIYTYNKKHIQQCKSSLYEDTGTDSLY